MVMKDIGDRPGEVFGQPVGIAHSKPLTRPVTLSWRTHGLTPWQRESLVLAKWDPKAQAWLPQHAAFSVSGNTITAHVQSFSFWDWVANGGQQVGEWTGTRTGPPACSKDPLPPWVQDVVNTDDDTKAAAILTCFEPDTQHPGVVSAKIVNNRTFTQQLVMTGGGQHWAWTWPGDVSYGVSDAVYSVAHSVFDSKTSFIVPPLTGVAVGVARPSSPGDYDIQATAKVNSATLLVDFTSFVFDQSTVGGTGNPLLNVWLEALYECGGKALSDHKSSDDMKDDARAVISSLVSCAADLSDPNSEAGKQFRRLAIGAIRSSGASEETVGKAYRTLNELDKAFKILTIGEVAFYLSDQLANALVGPLTLSVRGHGTPQVLGDWTPTCNNTKADSNALYRNLALQDAFADTRKELWQFPAWNTDAAAAVAPLASCSSFYRRQLADALPSGWGDKKGATIVADDIRAIGAHAPVQAPAPTPVAPAPTRPSSGAANATCERFSQLDANGQQALVQQMMDELGPQAQQWGIDVVLPNVRAMCSIYPPNTPISTVFTG
jgi:hypothetical protein